MRVLQTAAGAGMRNRDEILALTEALENMVYSFQDNPMTPELSKALTKARWYILKHGACLVQANAVDFIQAPHI